MSPKNWFKFIALGLVWGSSFFWIKIGLQEVGPVHVSFFRVVFASIGLGIFFLLKRKRLPLRFWWLFAFLGVFNVGLPFILVTWSEKYISSGMASIINSMQPLTTALFATLFIPEERLTLQRTLSLVLGFSGVLFLIYNRLNGAAENHIIGILTMLTAVFCYGGSAVFARKNNSSVQPEDQAFGQMVFGLVFILPVMLTFESPVTLPVLPISYVAFAWLGLLGSFFSSITWYGLMDEIGPSRLSMVTYMFPLVGVILGAITFQEKVGWQMVVGGLMILGAIVIVNYNKKGTENTPPVVKEQYEG